MGCAASKKTVSVTPALDSSGVLRENRSHGSIRVRGGLGFQEKEKEGEGNRGEPGGESGKVSLKSVSSVSVRLGNLNRYVEGEQVAAGWPAWLSAVAGEAIQGWVPLRADSFEKLEKIGQGTYSSVFRARDLDTGRVVALKKVRFDNFEPESVRFMSREILILRRLDHPNVVKLEGIITSRLSCSIYLVFEYMEHDLAGLSSCPDITFDESQVKCYMRQLLSGLEHCHSRGIIHRDIKGANLLINNEGILKIADFGLANFCSPGHKPLTSRVVTLWYRPPELLLGSTDYEASVDLWSVGCVFAEMFLKKPILQGRTEVEQLHKIFKLCGSPGEEYWKKSKLPHATIFKPHRPYESCLYEAFKSLPATAFSLLQTLLSIEPYKRGTASSCLASECFTTKPYACEPSSLPKYPPNKEIDAKSREELRRKRVARAAGRANGPEITRKPSKTYRAPQDSNRLNKLAAHPEESENKLHEVSKSGGNQDRPGVAGDTRLFVDLQPMPSINPPDEGRHMKHGSRGDISFSGPLHVNASSGFAWVKKPKEEYAGSRPYIRSNSRSHAYSGALDPSGKIIVNSKGQTNGNVGHEAHADSKGHEPYEIAKQAMLKKWAQLERPDSFNSSELHHSQEFSRGPYMGLGDATSTKRSIMGFQDQGDRVDFSGPLLSQVHKVDELLEKHERHIRQAVRRSWFQRAAGRKQKK